MTQHPSFKIDKTTKKTNTDTKKAETDLANEDMSPE